MKKTKRFNDEDEIKDLENAIDQSPDRQALEKRIETNGYCCLDCGNGYLTEKQKSESRVTTFHFGICVICSQEKSICHIRNFNWLRRPNK